ncbi:MAG: helix-turn-helix domain-containing protein, partial [Opitutaceae bacterium]
LREQDKASDLFHRGYIFPRHRCRMCNPSPRTVCHLSCRFIPPDPFSLPLPGREIATFQIQAIKSLLTETDWPLYRVAEETGFAYPEYLNVMFKRHTGLTPRSYRLQMGRARAES